MTAVLGIKVLEHTAVLDKVAYVDLYVFDAVVLERYGDSFHEKVCEHRVDKHNMLG
jgi:hypothetical protein